MKKLLSVALVMILMLGLGFLMIHSAFGAHTATVTWVESGSDVLAVSPISWPRWLNFTVFNNGPDSITEIKFVIQKDGDGNAFFRFENSKHKLAAILWTAIPDEFGPDNYPTVIYFRAEPSGKPIAPEATGEFDILFSDGPETCNYKFDLWTSDNGSPSGIDHNVLQITIDGEPPILDLIAPTDGKTVEAIFDPYPNAWYLWVNFTAADNPDHNSNISRIVVDIVEVNERPEWDITYEPPYKPKVIFNEKCWNLPEGNYTLSVTTFDGAGNSKTATIKFEFIVPRKLILTPPKGTVGPVTTYDSKTGLYTGSIYTYGTKTLGTTVTIEALKGAFTPNSVVNVTVHGLPYAADALVIKNVVTDSEGKFKASFLFPTAPQGTYTVTAVDAAGITDNLYFTVIPEIIYKPVVIIGPAPIEAIATGLTAYSDVTRFTCNGTDALLGVNRHVTDYWHTDENGTLKTDAAGKPGFLMPVLEPGTYEIGLGFGYYEVSVEGVSNAMSISISISNYLYVVNDFKALMDIFDELELKLDYITPIIETIDDNVASIKTNVGTIKADVKDIIGNITIIKGDVAEIKTKVGTILGKVESIAWTDVITIKTDVGTIKGKVEAINWNDIVTIKTDVGDIKVNVTSVKSKLEEMPTTLGISIAAVLSGIAAIASIVAVVVIIKRLKVAG